MGVFITQQKVSLCWEYRSVDTNWNWKKHAPVANIISTGRAKLVQPLDRTTSYFSSEFTAQYYKIGHFYVFS